MNKVFLIGNITRKPELKMTTSGKKVVNFTLAINRKKEITDFINLQAWEGAAEIISMYTDKGSKIAIEARIQSSRYENKEGKTIYEQTVIVDRIELLGHKEGSTESRSNGYQPDQDEEQEEPDKPNYDPDFDTGPKIDITSDDLPF